MLHEPKTCLSQALLTVYNIIFPRWIEDRKKRIGCFENFFFIFNEQSVNRQKSQMYFLNEQVKATCISDLHKRGK